jgi:uncharacterized phage infection (PIP) family protein YhgE
MAAPRNGKNDIAQKLLLMKKKLEEKKSKRSELQGEMKSIQKQLEEDFQVESLEGAEALIEEEEEKLQKMEAEIRKGIEEIEGLMEEG